MPLQYMAMPLADRRRKNGGAELSTLSSLYHWYAARLNMPDFKSEIRKSIAGLNLSAADEEQIVEELSQHLEEQFENAIGHGASDEEAEKLVLDELSGTQLLRDQLQQVKPRAPRTVPIGAPRAGRWFAGFWDDIRFGLRMLRKQPGFTVVAVLTLGIGVGASTAMLSLVQDVLLRPLPYAHSDRLYAIWASSESTGQDQIAASGRDFVDYLEQNRSFVHLAEYLPLFTFTWTGDGEPKLVNCTACLKAILYRCWAFARIWDGSMNRVNTHYLENDTLIVSYNFGRTSSVATRTSSDG